MTLLTVTEFFGAGCMAMLMTWRNVAALVPGAEMKWIAVGVTCLVIPSLMLESFGDLAIFSLLGAVAKLLTATLPVIIYCFWKVWQG